MTRDEFIKNNRIEEVLAHKRVELKGEGTERSCRCPFHEDKSASMMVNVDKGVWHCHAGCGGGSVIDLLAKFNKQTVAQFLKQEGIGSKTFETSRASTPSPAPTPDDYSTQAIEAIYDYRDAIGNLVYQVIRKIPKTFRQRRMENGKWVWNMDGVQRVPYRLQDLMRAETVWIVEGEKDAENLVLNGFVATTNVGGAGKWLDAYSGFLEGKDAILCGDNDEPGRKHIEQVFESIAGKVKSTRIVTVPEPHKDVSDFIAANPTPALALQALVNAATVFHKGLRIPVYTMSELEQTYITHTSSLSTNAFSMASWLPSLGREVRGLVPGEVVLIMGATGVGKTAILQGIALAALPMPTILFELELPPELLFERFLAARVPAPASEIERAYASGDFMGPAALDFHFRNLCICTESDISITKLESHITKAALKFGEPAKLVLVDYVQLMAGTGNSRYERTSGNAEALKRIARKTNTIIVMTSQIQRTEDGADEIHLYSGKDSGSLENSAGLVLGAWRDENDSTLLKIKVLKNTKGRSGRIIDCTYYGEQSRIVERTYAQPPQP